MKWSLSELERWAREYPQRFETTLPDGKAVTDTAATLALVKAVREAKLMAAGSYGFFLTGVNITGAIEQFDD